MSTLDKIGIKVESAEFGHNARPVLHEIRHALQRLADEGVETTIDLRALPFGPGDEALLLQTLGEGEVHATIDALGPTRVWETAFSGVWVLDHYNTDQQRVALQVEVCELPAILRAEPEDIRQAAQRMTQSLQETD